ncbi:MAG: tRNA (adenosine(37)-N6)-threonylcarbamoyltransferase complex transferase subunit TsaD [Patescibacteria group bacterium]|jgi:N6-L-threonylcarbamoyladenine synthase
MKILGIESSCDETAASVVEVDEISGGNKTLSNVISSQIAIHQKYGGVIPEVAAREHVLNILPVITEALETAKVSPEELDLLGVTAGPGLITSLISGVETARTLAAVWQKPLVGVNHIAGHIYSGFLDQNIPPQFPVIILTVSGGHTNLVLMKDWEDFEVIGETLDDAAGEAFDKGAKMLGLGYPGGPAIGKAAADFIASAQNTDLKFPRPLLGKGFNFSFSGLKTALLYKLQKDPTWSKKVSEYAFAYQEAIIDVLVAKVLAAVKKYQPRAVTLSGGVSANTRLREVLKNKLTEQHPDLTLRIPDFAYTTDNAAMIALAAYYANRAGAPNAWQNLQVKVNFSL